MGILLLPLYSVIDFYMTKKLSDDSLALFFDPCSSCRRLGPRLRAAEFLIGNKEHQEVIGRMGIKISTMADGRLQLLHSAGSVRSRSLHSLVETEFN